MKNRVVSLLGIALFLTSSSIFADVLVDQLIALGHSGKSYAGVGGGATYTQFKTNSTSSLLFPSAAFFTNSNNSANVSNTSPQGLLFVGYLFPVKSYEIGPEVYVSLGRSQFTTTQSANATLPTESLTTVSQGHLNQGEVGIDLRGGFTLQNTFLYGRFGAAFNTITSNNASTIARPQLPLAVSVNNSFNKSVVGYRLGVGMEQSITAKVNLRADYIFTHFPSASGYMATS